MSIYAEKSRWYANEANNLEMNFQHTEWKCPFHTPLTALRAVLRSVPQLCLTLCDPMDCSPPDPSVHGDSPGMNTGMGCHALLQGIFPIQGSNAGLLHCRRILYQLSYQGSPIFATSRDYTVLGILQPILLERVAIPSPTDFPKPGIKPGSPALQVDSLPAELPGKPLRALSGIKKTNLCWFGSTSQFSLPPIHPSGHQSSLYSVVVQEISLQLSDVTLWQPEIALFESLPDNCWLTSHLPFSHQHPVRIGWRVAATLVCSGCWDNIRLSEDSPSVMTQPVLPPPSPLCACHSVSAHGRLGPQAASQTGE